MLRKIEVDSPLTDAGQDDPCLNSATLVPRPTATPTPIHTVAARSPWHRRGAAVGVLTLLTLGLAACGGGSDNDSPAAPPPTGSPAPAPGPAPSPAPVPAPAPAPTPGDPTPAGFTKSGDILAADGTDVGDRFTKDTRVVVFDASGNKYYELVTPAAPTTWDAANTAATTAGGTLASPSTDVKMTFIKLAYTGTDLPEGSAATGGNGAWIGLQQAAGGALPGDNWSFLDGTALPGNSPLWNTGEPNDGGSATEVNAENFGGLFYGSTAAVTDIRMIYDAGATGSTDLQPKYLMEYATKEAIQ